MQDLNIQFGWYGENLPSGAYAVTVTPPATSAVPPASFIQTHMGNVAMDPGDVLLFTRCTVAGGFKIGGQSHIGRGTLLNAGNSGWNSVGGSCGTNACMFSPTGELLFDVDCSKYGSQGLRYWDTERNVPVSGDDTYNEQRGRAPELGIKQLWEWTKQGDIVIGQGLTGAVALYRGRRILLEAGDCRWIRFNREGDLCAITIVKQTEKRTLLLWKTPAELLSYPDEQAPPIVVVTPPPVIPPIVPPPINPPSNPIVNLPQNVKDSINRFVASFPVPQGPSPSDDPFENLCRDYMTHMAEQIVYDTGDQSYGNKNAGGGRPRSKDSIARQEQSRLINFDMLTGVGTGRPSLVADPQGEDITGQVFMAVTGKNHLGPSIPPVGVPNNPPPPSSGPKYDDTLIKSRLGKLDYQVGQLQAGIKALDTKITDLMKRLDGAHVSVDVGRNYGHSHPASGKLEL